MSARDESSSKMGTLGGFPNPPATDSAGGPGSVHASSKMGTLGGSPKPGETVRHVVDQLSAYLDGDMKAQAAELVRAHLADCAACARAAGELRAIVAGARSLERPEPPPTL